MQLLVHIGYHKTGTTWLRREVFSSSAEVFSQVGGAQRLIAVNAFSFNPKKVRKQMERRIGELRDRGLTPVLCRVVDAIAPASLLERHERRWRHRAALAVGTRYARSNARTAALTGLDLRTFGYACE